MAPARTVVCVGRVVCARGRMHTSAARCMHVIETIGSASHISADVVLTVMWVSLATKAGAQTNTVGWEGFTMPHGGNSKSAEHRRTPFGGLAARGEYAAGPCSACSGGQRGMLVVLRTMAYAQPHALPAAWQCRPRQGSAMRTARHRCSNPASNYKLNRCIGNNRQPPQVQPLLPSSIGCSESLRGGNF